MPNSITGYGADGAVRAADGFSITRKSRRLKAGCRRACPTISKSAVPRATELCVIILWRGGGGGRGFTWTRTFVQTVRGRTSSFTYRKDVAFVYDDAKPQNDDPMRWWMWEQKQSNEKMINLGIACLRHRAPQSEAPEKGATRVAADARAKGRCHISFHQCARDRLHCGERVLGQRAAHVRCTYVVYLCNGELRVASALLMVSLCAVASYPRQCNQSIY